MDSSCTVTVGRLMEIRIAAAFNTEADVDAQIARFRAAMGTVPADTRVVIVADWRRLPLMSGDVSARAVDLLTTTSERVERSGILCAADSATARMQFVRLVREAEHPDRKVFTSIPELEEWLIPVLTAAETKRLVEFVHE